MITMITIKKKKKKRIVLMAVRKKMTKKDDNLVGFSSSVSLIGNAIEERKATRQSIRCPTRLQISQ